MTYAGANPGFLEKGIRMLKGMGVRSADIISFFLKYLMKMKFVSRRLNYSILKGYLEKGVAPGGWFKWSPWISSVSATVRLSTALSYDGYMYQRFTYIF